MSHIVSIQAQIRDPVAIAAACRRMNLLEPVHGTAKMYAGEAKGLLVQLPGWTYPLVIDTAAGAIRYDNFEGRWGEQKEMDRFLQAYAVEKAKLEARRQGHACAEQILADGSIKLTIQAG